MSVMRGRTTSRSGSARGRKRAISSLSRSLSRSVAKYGRAANTYDGTARRGFTVGQSNSQFFDPFPRTMRAILRYTEVINFNATSPVASIYYFRAGSIHDPNYSGVGYQPYGHDTYASLYNHYRVIKSNCKIANTTAGGNNIMGICLSDDVALTGNFNDIKLVKPSKHLPLASTTESKTLAMSYDSDKSFPSQQQATTALFGNNPAEEQYFAIYVTGSNELSDPPAVAIEVNIEYYVEFSELQNLPRS